MWKANGKTTTLSLFLQSLFPKTDVLEEAVDHDSIYRSLNAIMAQPKSWPILS
jgi:hypothetical protein